MPKVFVSTWVFEAFEEDPSFFTKRMFGGLAGYVHDRMVVMLAENPGEKEYRGKKFKFDIWNGFLYPTDREYHNSIQKEFPSLIPHPVLPKWLYLPMNDTNFESTANEISECIAKNDIRFGIYPKIKSKKKKKKKVKMPTTKKATKKKSKKVKAKKNKKKVKPKRKK